MNKYILTAFTVALFLIGLGGHFDLVRIIYSLVFATVTVASIAVGALAIQNMVDFARKKITADEDGVEKPSALVMAKTFFARIKTFFHKKEKSSNEVKIENTVHEAQVMKPQQV